MFYTYETWLKKKIIFLLFHRQSVDYYNDYLMKFQTNVFILNKTNLFTI